MVDRRSKPRGPDDRWRTALTEIEPNKIIVRGYALDEMMGRLSFGEAIYLLLAGELPTPGIGKLVEAMLVSFIDHGPTPPSTLAARNVATTGATLRGCVSAGVLGFGRFFGGDIQSTMEMLERGLGMVRSGQPVTEAAAAILREYREKEELPPGFGHRIHTRDPRAARLFQMALELELDGEHVGFIRAMEMELHRTANRDAKPVPVNVDGAIAAVCGDLGMNAEIADGLFMISRIPGIIAHAIEEKQRHKPMRRIAPDNFVYDGPAHRRLPETRRG